MKSIKLPIKLIIIIMTVIGLAIAPACQASEPEVVEEETIIEEEPEAIEEPEATEGETEVSEEPEEEAIEGEPELLWIFEYEDLDFNLYCLAASPDGETLTVGSYLTTYTHLLYDGRIIDANTSHRHSVEDIDFSPDGSVMGVGLGVYGAVLIDTTDGSELFQLHGGFNNRLAFSPDGEHIATGNRDGIVWIWQLEDGQQVASFEEPEADYIQAIDYHPSGNLLAATHFNCNVHIWDVEEERIVHTIQLDVGEGSCGLSSNTFRFSPDSEAMVGAVKEAGDQLVRLWTVDGAEQIADLPVPERVRDLAFSPDGTLLVVASRLATTIWDIPTKTLLYTLDQTFDALASNSPVAAAFTPDGGHIAVVRNDGTLELWRLPEAEPIEAPPVDMQEPPPIPGDVLFDTGSAELKATADAVLEELAADLYAALPEARIKFIGHTDSRGESGYNLQLSIDRATAVKDWFENWADENGVDSWELFVDGRGSSELKVPDTDVEGTFLEDAGALNRRVEIEIEVVN
jgi:WD40 repeat protein